ncbi:MAG: c-type cytochrome biogenesis protein CcmI [Pseudomonadales bacterium]|nr:c-type cytochrome biogenesis protein CcmI [Pseudomonadales bacterium]MBO7005239.1 c-type cytochrome biogenesis protein CcmI [Pseudomonadales bacterium]
MSFYLGALGLALLASVFVLLPLARSKQEETADRSDLNVSLYREHVGELGTDEDAEALTREAQKNLLLEADGQKDTTEAVNASPDKKPASRWLIGTALVLPVFAALIYFDAGIGQGAMSDVELTERFETISMDDRIAYRRFVGQIERRASQKPDDPDLQFLLSRAYLNIEAYAASAEVMSGLVAQFPGDHNLLSQYAEVLYLKAGRKVDSEVDSAIDVALRANPHDVSMMEIRAIGAMQEGNEQTALAWFQKALDTGITGQRAELIRRAVARIGGVEETAVAASAAGRSLRVMVSKADEVAVSQASTVFVYARAANGPPAPLAVQRLPLARLPMEVTLNETMAMVPGMSLATFDEVVVIARISQSGQVTPSPGDYEARSEILDLTSEVSPIRLLIADPVSE